MGVLCDCDSVCESGVLAFVSASSAITVSMIRRHSAGPLVRCSVAPAAAAFTDANEDGDGVATKL